MTSKPGKTSACLRPVQSKDLPAILDLHRRAFGPGRFAVTAYRVREGTPAITPFCRVVELNERLVAAVRLTPIRIGETSGALLLGPITVDPGYINEGHGGALINASLAAARNQGPSLVILVGNASYYGRFGFIPVPHGQITFPGPVDPARILAFELTPGALVQFHGEIGAEGVDHASK